MSVFDPYLREVADYVDGLARRGRRVRTFPCPESPEAIRKAFPLALGPNANPRIILRSEAHMELGSPLAGSCAFVLWTEDVSLVRDGTLTLVGPDIPESGDASLPFGQIMMLAGARLATADHESLVQRQYVADQIEGYMIKSAPDRIWSRVSRGAAEKGFDFRMLGRALRSIVKGEDARIEAMEMLFVTSSKEDVQALAGLASQTKKIGSEMVKETWKLRGYDIDCDLDCSSCGDRPVCDDIRDLMAKRKKKDRRKASGA